MEATYENPLDDQDWGECFVKHEKEFEVYDAYIANYGQALDLALAEQPTLMVRDHSVMTHPRFSGDARPACDPLRHKRLPAPRKS